MKRQITVEELEKKLSDNEKYLKEQYKNLKYKTFLKDTQYRKVLNKIDGAHIREAKLKEKLKSLRGW